MSSNIPDHEIGDFVEVGRATEPRADADPPGSVRVIM